MTKRSAGPPALAALLLRIAVRGVDAEFVIGDLNEEFRRFVLPRIGPRLAARWYWSQAVRTAFQYRLPPRSAAQLSAAHTSGVTIVSTLWMDLRYAIRTLARAPGFATLVIVTLGLGIGASTAIFTAVNQVMLRPLTVNDPDVLAMLWESNAERGWQQVHAAPANIMDWRERVEAFEDVAFLNDFTGGAALTGEGDAVFVQIGSVSGNLFSVLGVTPQLGRAFTMEETWAESEPVAILSHGLWQRQFGGDPDILGRVIRLDEVGYQVVGVMPAEFRYEFNAAELWTPYRWTTGRRESVWFRQAHVARAVARLRAGVGLDQARAELETVARQLQEEHPELNRGMEAGMTPLHQFLVGDRRVPLLLLLGAVGLLQLIACSNVANLLLTRAVGRGQEFAVRSALGAGRMRIARQVFTESAVMATAGAMLGVVLGAVLVVWMAGLQPANMPDLTFGLDWRVVLFAVGVTGGSALLFGLAPVLRSLHLDPIDDLAGGGRGGSLSPGQQRATGAFSALQVALALMLVVGAGLMMQSLVELRRVDAGVDPDNVLTMALSPPRGTYPTDRDRAELVLQYIERLRGLPGVDHVGAVRQLALQGGGWTSDFSIDSWPPDRFGLEVKHREATGGYFRALSVPLLAGAPLPERVEAGESIPVVVNQAFVEMYFPDESPVGRRIAFDRAPTQRSYWYTIVGVVGNERHQAAAPPEPEIIAHLQGDMPGRPRIAIKTRVDPVSLVPPARAALAELNPNVPLVDVQTMNTVVASATAREVFLTSLLGVFAALALGLACVGVYGVAAQAARARGREIGIRIALGATNAAIVGHLLRRGAIVAATGLTIGLGGAVVGTRLMRSMLYEVEPTDPVTFLAVSLLLATVVFVSSYLPARRATRVDPVTVLRTE